MITVYRRYEGTETVVCSVADDNATHTCTLMGKDEVVVDVTTDSVLPVEVLDCIYYDGLVYTLNREPVFTKASEVEYRYTFTFEHPLYNLLDKGYVYPITRQTRFTLTGTLRDFAALVVSNANQIDPGWTVGKVPDTEFKNIVFESITCGDVLNKLANEFSVEYHIVGKRIDFYDRYENFTPLVFEQGRGKGLYTLSRQNVDDDNTVTRAVLFGGTQNLPYGYRDGSEYLRWSDGAGNMYVENFEDYPKIVERDVYFEDVWPRFDGALDGVRGTNNETVKCSAIDFNVKDYCIGGVAAKVNFLTGDLSGIAFEFTYDHAARELTLIGQEDETAAPDASGTRPLIPNATRKARVGDKINFTDLFMPAEYVARAEEELHTKGVEWLNMNSQLRVKFELDVDYRYMAREGVALRIGDVVRIKVPETGIDRRLRIISLEKKLHTGSIRCEVSNYPKYSWEKELEGKVQAAKDKVEVIKSEILYDINASKAWTARNFARLFGGNDLIGDQRIEGDLSVREVTFQSIVENISDKMLWLKDKLLNDNIILKLFRVHSRQVLFSDRVSSERYVSGSLGEGAAVYKDEVTGKWIIEGDTIKARESLQAAEFLIDKIRALKGSQVITPGGGAKIKGVTAGASTFAITLEEDANPFVVNDLVRCQVFTPGRQKFYWVQVLSASGDSITVSKAEFLEFLPEPGDEIVQLGNLTDTSRQSAIYISASDTGAPLIDVLEGISARSLEGRLKVRLGNLSGITDPVLNPHGYGLYALNCFLSGNFRLSNGQAIEQYVEGMGGTIQSNIITRLTAEDGEIQAAVKNETGHLATKTELSAALTIRDGQITATVGRVDKMGGQISSIKQTADKISLAVDSMQIGGVNLFRNYRTVWSAASGVAYQNGDGTWTATDFWGFFNFSGMALQVGKTYTFSILLKRVSGSGGNVLFYGIRSEYLLVSAGDNITGEFERYSVVAECNASGLVPHMWLPSGTVIVGGVQVEEGNMRTPISQAPEDVPTKLLTTGIDIENGKVNVTADQFTVKGRDGRQIMKASADGNIVEMENVKVTGEINATKGIIGGFKIEGDYIGVAASGTESTGNTGFSLSPTLVRFSDNKMWAGLGSYVFPATSGNIVRCPMRVSIQTGDYVSDDYSYGNIGLYISVTGKTSYDDIEYSGNHALYIPEGFITGFRLRPRRVSASTTLTNMDSWIFGIAASAMTLTLPSAPKDGQIYFIKKVGNGNITIQVGNSSHLIQRWGSTATNVVVEYGNLAFVMWDRVNLKWSVNVCSSI